MVGYNSKSAELKPGQTAIAGALSGCFTRATCQPLDVLKIRFQLQVEPISYKFGQCSKYKSIFQGFSTIYREEGIKSLWKGHIPAQYLSISYGLVQFWFYELATKNIGTQSSFKLVSDFYCGALAGSLATLISFPFDVVRTRLVAQSEKRKVYKGLFNTVYTLVSQEGFRVLYKGFTPTIIQVAPHTGVQFMSFKFFENIYRQVISDSTDSFGQVFASGIVCGSLSGLCAKTAIYPFDLCRKRLQIQGFDRQIFGQNFVCRGLIDCFRVTYRCEGLLGLFKGLSPSLIKAVATSALHFTCYDIICYEIAKFNNL